MSKHDTDHDQPAVSPAGDQTESDDEPSETNSTGQQTADPEPADSQATPDFQSKGKAEAKRLLRAVEGDTEAERTEAALAKKRETLEQSIRQLRQIEQRRQQAQNRAESLDYTAERLAETDDDQLVVQELAGGVSVGVPADEREAVREEVCEREQTLRQRADELADQLDSLERRVRIDRIALDHLQNHEDLVTE